MDNNVNKNNNKVDVSSYVGAFIIVALIVFFGYLFISNISSPKQTEQSSSSYGTELSSDEARRLFSATVGYAKKHPYLISGNIIEDGSYRCRESKGSKYLYDMTIKYNPNDRRGYADTTKIKSTSLFVVYDASTDTFDVYSTLHAAQEKFNK